MRSIVFYKPAGVAIDPNFTREFYNTTQFPNGVPDSLKDAYDQEIKTYLNSNRFEVVEKNDDGSILSFWCHLIDINSNDIPSTVKGFTPISLDDKQLVLDRWKNYATYLKQGVGIWQGAMYLIDKQLSGEYKLKP